jgi:hypothetical protein
MFEWLTRCCRSYDHVTISDYENRLLNGTFDPKTKRILVKRKTLIRIIIIFKIISLGFTVFHFVTAVKNDEHSITHDSYTNLMYIIGSILFIDVCNCVLLYFAQMCWYIYRYSANYVLISGFLTLYLNLIFIYIPYRNVITMATGVNLVDTVFNWYIFITIVFTMLKFLMPNLLVIQSMIRSSNSLLKTFPAISEFKIMSIVLISSYIPVYILVLGVIYQYNYDNLIIGFVIVYTVYLVLPLYLKNKISHQIFNIVSSIALFILAGFLLDSFGVNIIDLFVGGLIEYMHINLILTDFLISTASWYKPSEDTFFKDITGVASILENNYERQVELSI